MYKSSKDMSFPAKASVIPSFYLKKKKKKNEKTIVDESETKGKQKPAYFASWCRFACQSD